MSYQIKIDPKSRKAARFISQLQKTIQDALTASGKTQQEVANILGIDRSVVNRRLKGSTNLTARSIAEFAYAFDKDIVLEFVDKVQVENNNRTTASGNAENIQRYSINVLPTGTIATQVDVNLESATS